MPTISKDKIIFDQKDWLSGLSPQFGTSITGLQKMGDGLAQATAFNPFRYLGYAFPGHEPYNLTNASVVDAVATCAVVHTPSATPYAFIGAGTKLHQLNLTSDTITNGATFPYTVSGVANIQDVVVYDVNISSTRVKRLFYSWYDTTDGDIGVYDFSTTFDIDWLSTVPASAAVLNKLNPMPMIVGADDILYFSDGNSVHALDGATGTNGTLSKNVLVLPKGYTIRGFARLSDSLAIFADTSSDSYYRSKATCFFWNYIDQDPYRIIELDDNYMGCPIEYQGTIGCFTQGRSSDQLSGRSSRLKIFNGSRFVTAASFVANIPSYGGAEVLNDLIVWNSTGDLYAYGSPLDGMQTSFNKIGKVTGTSNGLVKNFGSNLLAVSSGTGTSGGLQYMLYGGCSTASFTTSLADASFGRAKGEINGIKVKFACKNSTSTARELTLTLYDETGTSLGDIISAVKTVDDTNLNKVYYNLDGKQFNALKLYGSWATGGGSTTAPLLDYVEVYYKTINI